MDFEGKTVLTNNNKKNQNGQKGNDKRLQKLKHKEEAALRLREGKETKCNDVDSIIIKNQSPVSSLLLLLIPQKTVR